MTIGYSKKCANYRSRIVTHNGYRTVPFRPLMIANIFAKLFSCRKGYFRTFVSNFGFFRSFMAKIDHDHPFLTWSGRHLWFYSRYLSGPLICGLRFKRTCEFDLNKCVSRQFEKTGFSQIKIIADNIFTFSGSIFHKTVSSGF